MEDGDEERQGMAAAADEERDWGWNCVRVSFYMGKNRALGGLFTGLWGCTRPCMTVFETVTRNPSCINRFLVVNYCHCIAIK